MTPNTRDPQCQRTHTPQTCHSFTPRTTTTAPTAQHFAHILHSATTPTIVATARSISVLMQLDLFFSYLLCTTTLIHDRHHEHYNRSHRCGHCTRRRRRLWWSATSSTRASKYSRPQQPDSSDKNFPPTTSYHVPPLALQLND